MSGHLEIGIPKELTIEFNCLGIETRTQMTLHIELGLFSPIILSINKECNRESFADKLAEKIVNSKKAYIALKVALYFFAVCGIVYLMITCYNLKKGKPLEQSVPCGRLCVAFLFRSRLKNDHTPIKTGGVEVTDMSSVKTVSNFSDSAVLLLINI